MSSELDTSLDKLEGFLQGFFWILPNIGVALIVFLLFLAASWVVQRAVHRMFRRRRHQDLGELLGGFARWSTIAFGFLVVATIVFPSISPANLLSTLGIGSIAVGFAFKDILQNWMSGLLILYRGPFRRGDQIVSGSYEGTVEHVDARATVLRTYDGQRVVIPNSEIYTGAVTVRTAFPTRRSEYTVGIGYGDDIDLACRVIMDAIRDLDGIVKDPPPEAFAWEIDSSTINIKVRWWTESRRGSVVAAQGRVVRAIKQALTEAQIDIAYPTQTILFHDQTDEADGDRRRQREGWPAGNAPPAPRHLNEVVVDRSSDDHTDERSGRDRAHSSEKKH